MSWATTVLPWWFYRYTSTVPKKRVVRITSPFRCRPKLVVACMLLALLLAGCATGARVDQVSFDRGAFALAYADLVTPMRLKCAASPAAPTPACAQLAAKYRTGWLEWAYTGNDPTSSSPNGQALVLDPSKPLYERGSALEQLRQLLDRQLPR